MSNINVKRILGVFTLPLVLAAGCDEVGPEAARDVRNERIAVTSLKLTSAGDNYLLHPVSVAVQARTTGAAYQSDIVVGLWSDDGSVGCTLGAMQVTHDGGKDGVFAKESVFVVPATCHELVGRDDLALFVSFDPWNQLGDRDFAAEGVSGYKSEYQMMADAALGDQDCGDCDVRHALHDTPGMDAQLRELNLSSSVVVVPVDPDGDAFAAAADRPDFNLSASSRVVGLPPSQGLDSGRVQIHSRLRPLGSHEAGRPLIQRKGGVSSERAPVRVPGHGDVTTGLALYFDDATREALIAGEWSGVDEFELVTCLETDFKQAVYNGETEPRADDCGTIPITVVRPVVDLEAPVLGRSTGKVRSAEVWGDSWGANSSYGFGYSGLTFTTWLDVNASDVATTTYKGINVHSAGSWFEAGVDSYATVFGTNINLIDLYATFIGYEFGGGGVAMAASLFVYDFIPEFEIQLADGVPLSLQEILDAADLDIDPTVSQSVSLVGVNFDGGCGTVTAGLWVEGTLGLDTEQTTITASSTSEGIEVAGTVTPFFNLAAKGGVTASYSGDFSGGIVATMDLLNLDVPFTVSVEYVDFSPMEAVKLVFSEHAEAILTALSGDVSFWLKYDPWWCPINDCVIKHEHTIASWDGISTGIEFFDLTQTLRIGDDTPLSGWCTHSGSEIHTGDFDGDGAPDYMCHDRNDGRKWIDYDGAYNGTDWNASTGFCVGDSLLIGDFNGDGRDDLFCNDYSTRSIDYTDASGHFGASEWSHTLTWCQHSGAVLETGDYNGDGRDDLYCHDNVGKKWLDYADTSGRFGGTDWQGTVLPNSFCGQYDGDTIALKTYHNKYLGAADHTKGWIIDQVPAIGSWQKFVVDCDGEDVSFKTVHNRYIQANDAGGGWITRQQTFIGPWEKFTAVEQDDGTWAFLTYHSRYLQALDANTGWQIKEQTYVGDWEKFIVVPQ
ncbi:FG-GAP repeat domain-containing protein [Nannocystis radixulma]|uniref:VCBS repeat-containing protein n=1 Tax=Nannocystis radixulma TaxID=2995305 RepID=A0ABT5BH01_9BACT|nr:VCBS repeat-containing protein [Nannocystis radixulma]MDC0673425.1 VCBS repeat-containing protein [Nannocystis radixulma]